MPKVKKINMVGFSFSKNYFIMLGTLIIFFLFIYAVCAYRDGYVDAHLSRNGWNFSTSRELLETSDGKLRREGRYFQIGPLKLDFYGGTKTVDESPVINDTNVPVARQQR